VAAIVSNLPDDQRTGHEEADGHEKGGKVTIARYTVRQGVRP